MINKYLLIVDTGPRMSKSVFADILEGLTEDSANPVSYLGYASGKTQWIIYCSEETLSFILLKYKATTPPEGLYV